MDEKKSNGGEVEVEMELGFHPPQDGRSADETRFNRRGAWPLRLHPLHPSILALWRSLLHGVGCGAVLMKSR